MYGVKRFDDFQRDLGVARNILTERLAKLTARGVLEKVPYAERPPRYEYRLTAKGKDLMPVLLTMMTWGDRWETDNGPPVTLTHTTCGADVVPKLTCPNCGDELQRRDLRIHPIRIRGVEGFVEAH